MVTDLVSCLLAGCAGDLIPVSIILLGLHVAILLCFKQLYEIGAGTIGSIKCSFIRHEGLHGGMIMRNIFAVTCT